MSWSASVEIPAGCDPEDLRERLAAAKVVGNDDCPAERERAVAAVRVSAMAVITSGACGDPARFGFHVAMSGHANPNNQPRGGWSPDCVSLHVAAKESG